MREWCQAAGFSQNVPFYDTINRQVNPREPVWFTCIFVAETHEGTVCEPQYFEKGYIELAFVGLPGLGDGPVIAALEKVLPVVMANLDPTNRLILESYEPIIEESMGTADATYRVYVSVNYSFGPP
jgi:hypothetical protein